MPAPATAEEALAAGAWKVVPKPVDFAKLLGLVDEALDQPLVLIVDDDRDLVRNLWDLLRERGFRVCLAHDCREAAEQLKQSTFKVVLIDMRIPDGDGGSGVPDGPRGEPASAHDPDHGLPLRDGSARRADARRGGRRGLLQAVRRPGAARDAGATGRDARGRGRQRPEHELHGRLAAARHPGDRGRRGRAGQPARHPRARRSPGRDGGQRCRGARHATTGRGSRRSSWTAGFPTRRPSSSCPGSRPRLPTPP